MKTKKVSINMIIFFELLMYNKAIMCSIKKKYKKWFRNLELKKHQSLLFVRKAHRIKLNVT